MVRWVPILALLCAGGCNPQDQDGDGVPISQDCDDLEPSVKLPLLLHDDNDQDGLGDGATGSERCPRPGLVEDVANAALWLASDESGYTNGHTLTTDAGITVGATVAGPAFSAYAPMIREAGRSGL